MQDENDIGEKSREVIQRRESSLDQETVKRLQEIRQQAVTIATQKRRSRFSLQGLSRLFLEPQGGVRVTPIIGIVAASVLVATITVQLQLLAPTPVDDLTILTSGDDFDVIQDLDFYDWLLEVDSNG